MEPIIEFEHFSYKYRAQKEPTLKDITLKIYPGEKVLIAGPSGCGKSTIAKCINGLVPSSFPGEITGKLKVAGLVPHKADIFGMSKHVGTVLQDTDGQFIGLTVAEDISFVLENDCVPHNELCNRVLTTAKTLDITNLLDKSPSALSGGQKQRVSIAGVLVDDVEILLFDEPLANLDPATGKSTIELIDKLHKQNNKTVIIIEHRLEDVLWRSVDRIILVNNGSIIADCPPQDLLCTNILSQNGIREPLYIAALKQAGCSLESHTNPQHIDTINLTNYAPLVRQWFNNYSCTTKQKELQPVLQVKNLSFEYTPSTAATLKDVSFTIHQGEMLSIAGKNGAGKSTLSSLICGFIKPSSGSIYLNGKDISPLSIKERGEIIGLVMQNPNQMISKPMIFDEVALGLRVRNVNEDLIKQRVYDVLKICGLYKFRNWPINALSFGQKKRVTIASILVLNPRILILDEPTAGQDYKHYTEIMEFLRQLNEKHNITIVMITHDMHLMLEYTDRAIVLADGHVIADDKCSKILTDTVVTQKAYLKQTSLYDLSNKCGITQSYEFVEKFIHDEQGHTLCQE